MIKGINKKREPGPTRTGQFIDNIDWWFWDGANYPGLITREKFSELMETALSKEERGELIRMLMIENIYTPYRNKLLHRLSHYFHNKKKAERRLFLFSKLNDYLNKVGELKNNEINNWVLSSWNSPCLTALKAYINVLEFWGFRYSWEEIVDARSEPALIISHKNKPVVCVLETDIEYIQGRPFRFTIEISRRATWYFEESQTGIIISLRRTSKNPLNNELELNIKHFLVSSDKIFQ